jgi:RNA polymerase subunit RPABC4/transcription elongation factor Spt4
MGQESCPFCGNTVLTEVGGSGGGRRVCAWPLGCAVVLDDQTRSLATEVGTKPTRKAIRAA